MMPTNIPISRARAGGSHSPAASPTNPANPNACLHGARLTLTFLGKVYCGKRIRFRKRHILREHHVERIPFRDRECRAHPHALPEVFANGLLHHLPATIPRGISGRVGVEPVVAVGGQRDPGRDERQPGRGAIALPEMPVDLIAHPGHPGAVYTWHATERQAVAIGEIESFEGDMQTWDMPLHVSVIEAKQPRALGNHEVLSSNRVVDILGHERADRAFEVRVQSLGHDGRNHRARVDLVGRAWGLDRRGQPLSGGAVARLRPELLIAAYRPYLLGWVLKGMHPGREGGWWRGL